MSGGERKRANIGVELLNDPPLIFMDEPTSGLDSFQAQAVVQTLRTLSREGKTVIASIHQPRSSIYKMLDQVCLLAGGDSVYFGPAAVTLASHFESLGHPIPRDYNPADFLMDLISVDRRTDALEEESTKRVGALVGAWGSRGGEKSPGGSVRAGDGRISITAAIRRGANSTTRAQWAARNVVATRLLFRRTWRELTRDKFALCFKHGFGLFFALLFGVVYQASHSIA